MRVSPRSSPAAAASPPRPRRYSSPRVTAGAVSAWPWASVDDGAAVQPRPGFPANGVSHIARTEAGPGAGKEPRAGAVESQPPAAHTYEGPHL